MMTIAAVEAMTQTDNDDDDELAIMITMIVMIK